MMTTAKALVTYILAAMSGICLIGGVAVLSGGKGA